MRKTVTTILSLALALILVSSLSSGVILAKTVKVHHVVILDCGIDEFETFTFVVTGLQSSTGDEFDITVATFEELYPTSCVEGMAAILEAGFKMLNIIGGFNPTLATSFPGSEALFSRYTFLKTTKVRVPK